MSNLIKEILDDINSLVFKLEKDTIPIMEVCGTHTMAISRAGIRDVLPKEIKLISGPGCPVCVTSPGDIDCMIELAMVPDVIVTTFGDMLRVPGSHKNSLELKKGEGADIRIVYSPMDALEIAANNPSRKVVFLSVGFETTVPSIAITILEGEKRHIDNFIIYPANKLIPPAMKLLVLDDRVKIGGFICPGNVSIIIGSKPYEFLAADYGIPCVIAGFEPFHILSAIKDILLQLLNKEAEVMIGYKEWVRPQGNSKALNTVYRVFEPSDVMWRGLGSISLSGLRLREEFLHRDVRKAFNLSVSHIPEPEGCMCGNVLKGIAQPSDCRLFRNVCRPEMPVGPCMVSSEGTCAIYYKYGGI